jgi:site-specific recombinase XerD
LIPLPNPLSVAGSVQVRAICADHDHMERVGHLTLRYVHERRELGHFAPSTAEQVRFTLWRFAVFIGEDQPPTRITTRAVERWMLAQHVAPSSLRNRFSQLRMFVRWLVQHRYLRSDPTTTLSPPRQPRYLPRGLGVSDIDLLVDQTVDPRLRVMVLLMVREGLRCCEVAALQLGDLDADAHVMIVNGKGGHQRMLPVSDQTWEALERYGRLARTAAGPLIRSTMDPHRGINAKTLSRVVGRAMREAGVSGSAHGLRHSFARGMVDRGADIRAVRDALGHRSLTTTSMYIGSTPPDALRQAMTTRRYGHR